MTMKQLLTQGGVPKDPDHRCHVQKEKERVIPTLLPFVRPSLLRRCLCGVMVKALEWGIVVSEFELHSRYGIHFWTNTLGKGMNPLILPGMG